ncbi:hypothetical protein E6C76_20110 [Pseudothauera nasutitermitis]|uniref:Uncharacterized protein n=1 Tax=Pseudothauera nasutitermitis TaxID=2565930 RepID=A0A4S4ANZ7_9RHOO|nr:hypothetical protein [Pseudothauera nasutitermitis]THF61390.1 hypothetical protein E6C76_20110 [Pseudothauera nasutitermitis]
MRVERGVGLAQFGFEQADGVTVRAGAARVGQGLVEHFDLLPGIDECRTRLLGAVDRGVEAVDGDFLARKLVDFGHQRGELLGGVPALLGEFGQVLGERRYIGLAEGFGADGELYFLGVY